MDINETIEKLGEEISKLSQRFEKLRRENQELKEKNVSLEKRLEYSVTEDRGSNDKLGNYLDQIKELNQSNTETTARSSTSFIEDNSDDNQDDDSRLI